MWDFGNSNHFVDLFRVMPADGERFPPYAFLMHFAGDELRGDTVHAADVVGRIVHPADNIGEGAVLAMRGWVSRRVRGWRRRRSRGWSPPACRCAGPR